MAKSKGTQKLLAAQRAGIIASRRVYAEDRMGDFNFTTSGIDALFANASSGVSARARALTAQQARQMEAIAGLRGRTDRGTARDMGNARASISNMFGSAIAGATAPLLRQGDTHARAANQTMRGVTRAGGVTAAGGQAVMGILGKATEEAQAAAEYGTATALAYRAKEDAKLIADQQAQLRQSQLDFQFWKKQQEYLKKQEEKDPKLAGVSIVAQTATDSAKKMRDFMAANPGATVDQLVDAATEGDTGLANDAAAAPLLRQLALNVKSTTDSETGMTVGGISRSDDAAAIAGIVNELYPDFKNSKASAAIAAQLNALYAASAASGDATAGAQQYEGKAYGSVKQSQSKVSLNDLEAARALPNGNYISSEGVPFTVDNHQVIVNGSTVF